MAKIRKKKNRIEIAIRNLCSWLGDCCASVTGNVWMQLCDAVRCYVEFLLFWCCFFFSSCRDHKQWILTTHNTLHHCLLFLFLFSFFLTLFNRNESAIIERKITRKKFLPFSIAQNWKKNNHSHFFFIHFSRWINQKINQVIIIAVVERRKFSIWQAPKHNFFFFSSINF